MTLHLITALLVSGLGSLSVSESRQFHVVKKGKTWTDAQQYCREKFTDLATIDDMAELEKLKSLINEQNVPNAWIGLKKGNSPKWQWSLSDRDFYRESEAEFRNWGPGQPEGHGQECVVMNNGKWYDLKCSKSLQFICYDGGNSTHPYVLVTDKKNWAAAQKYCREKHTDLASVRNHAEINQIGNVSGGRDAWIGLFRDAWEWSDGSSSSFRNWNTGEPDKPGLPCSQIVLSGRWNDENCVASPHFICYEEPEVKRQIVRVTFPVTSEVNVNDPAVQQAILEQIQKRLRDSGMPADAKLTWKRQTDGKIFKEEKKKEKKEEGSKKRKKTEL